MSPIITHTDELELAKFEKGLASELAICLIEPLGMS
jgi:hypothetical protein